VTDNRLTWAAAIAVWSALAGGLALTDVESPLRTAIVLSFLLVCPGAGWVRLLPLGDTLAILTASVAFSIALDAAVAGILLYSHVWSPTAAFLIVAGLGLVGALVQVAFSIRAQPTLREQ
jgi:hypothetical protein